MRKLLTKTLFTAYGTFFNSSLQRVFEDVKKSHELESAIKNVDIDRYLEAFSWKTDLKSAPLTVKADITKHASALDPSRIHSYAYTGGSYGEPFKLPYSKKRAVLRTASFKYFNEAAGYTVGDPFLLIAAKEKPRWWQYLRNEYRFVPRALTEAKIKSVVELLAEKKIKAVIGFPSVIYELAAYIKAHNISHQVNAVIFTSEPVDEIRRAFIKDAFKCRVTDRYSNEEVGLIAQQKEFGGVYYTNRYNVLVEVLNENNVPVKAGESGNVVVTDFKADLVPVIRYKTGDRAIAHEYRHGQLYSLRAIEGRTAEQILNVRGTKIAPLAFGPLIHKPLSEAEYYNQYQFAQVGAKSYELRIKSGGEIASGVIQKIKNNLLQILGEEALIGFKFVDDIRPQNSGKRPLYKNEWLTA